MNNDTLELKGRFRKVFAGGESKGWVFAFCSFVSVDNKNYSVYMKNTKVELDTYYDIEISPQENRDTYVLKSLSISKPDNDKEVRNILLANVSGLGAATIEKIEEIKGKDIWETILEQPDQVRGIIKDSVYQNLVDFCKIYSTDNLSFFVNNGLTLFHSKLVQKFGNENFVELFKTQEDPYSLYIDYNFKFEEVENFVKLLLPNMPIEQKLRAFIYHALNELAMNNNTLFYLEDIINEISKDFAAYNNSRISRNQIISVIQEMINKGELYYNEENSRIGLTSMRDKERFIAYKVKELAARKDLKSYDLKVGESFSASQVQAYKNTFDYNFSIISGYPGTGKSYIISKIIDTLSKSKHYKQDEIALLTPTGRAATILTRKCPIEARTIHSYLKLSKDDEAVESYEYSNNAKVVIIDEFSMVNINIFYLVLELCPKLEKLILVGDENQLQCIGPGNILEDLINSKKFPVVHLNEVYRTDKRDIFEHFIAINNNKKPVLQSQSVNFMEFNPSEFLRNVISLYQDKVNEYSIDEVVLLLPSYAGQNGINAVNSILQKWNVQYNELKDPLTITAKNEKLLFYKSDKVIQLVNDYEKDVFNGEIGYISEVFPEDGSLEVDFGDKKVKYNRSEILENLKLAYAITVHKFQGSESKCVIFGVIPRQAEHMLTKKLLYTAVSRAKDELLLIGSSVLYYNKILDNRNNAEVYTNLKDFLKED